MNSANTQIYWLAAPGLPKNVCAGQTLAYVNKSESYLQEEGQYFGQQNFALHVGDEVTQVQIHRMQLLAQLQSLGVQQLRWLNQTHSTIVHRVEKALSLELLDGDGLVTTEKGVALVMMTADCLPIVLSNQDGSEVACLHAGWRGLANGIIEKTCATMTSQVTHAWIGAAISQENFQIGAEVRDIFLAQNPSYHEDFLAQDQDKYLADLYAIARKKLQALGVEAIGGGERCSFKDESHFYSYRRQAKTGRMATFIFIR